jgi:uncharacterized protein (DUF1330 family)
MPAHRTPSPDRPTAEKRPTPGYAVGHLHRVAVGPEIVQYLKRIDATLEPFGGRWIIHGARAEVLEGDWSGNLIVIGFPDLDHARAWYESSAYQEILPLRTNNADGDILLVDGAEDGHRATDVIPGLPTEAKRAG